MSNDAVELTDPAPGKWTTWLRSRQADRLLTVFVCLLTAVLLVVSYPPFDTPEAAYVWAVPFLVWIYLRQPRWSSTLLVAGASQIAAWIYILKWLRHFAEHAGIAAPVLVGWAAMIALGSIVGLFGFAWLCAVRWILPACREGSPAIRILSMLGLAGFWVVLEWIRTYLFTGFPWLLLGVSQWQRPLVLQIAAHAGTWGVSCMLILFNLGLLFYLRTFLTTRGQPWFRRFCPEFYIALVAMLVAIGSGFTDQSRSVSIPAFSAGFVQPAVLPRDRWDPEQIRQVLDDYEMVARFASFDGADAILWPEASTPLPAPGNPYAEEWLESLSSELELPILMGNLVAQPDDEGILRFYNGVIVVDPVEGISERFYAKRHLVPFGEYVPRWIPFLDTVVPLEGQFTPGVGPQVLDFPVKGRNWRVGALVCYEDLFAYLAREQVHQGVSFFFVATNNVWYGREGAAYQHAAHSVLRAVEFRRPVLRAGNEGWSGWIDERGNIRHVLRGADGSIYFRGADAEMFSLNSRYQGILTPYARHGDWFVLVSLLFALAAGVAGHVELRKLRKGMLDQSS